MDGRPATRFIWTARANHHMIARSEGVPADSARGAGMALERWREQGITVFKTFYGDIGLDGPGILETGEKACSRIRGNRVKLRAIPIVTAQSGQIMNHFTVFEHPDLITKPEIMPTDPAELIEPSGSEIGDGLGGVPFISG
jgi:hypothetical protein